jgi:hypothetical protein
MTGIIDLSLEVQPGAICLLNGLRQCTIALSNERTLVLGHRISLRNKGDPGLQAV